MHEEKIKEMVLNFEKVIRTVKKFNNYTTYDEIIDILSWSGALLLFADDILLQSELRKGSAELPIEEEN